MFLELWSKMMVAAQHLADTAKTSAEDDTLETRQTVLVAIDLLEDALNDLKTYYTSGGERVESIS